MIIVNTYLNNLFHFNFLDSNSLLKNSHQFDPDWCADTLECEENNITIRKNGMFTNIKILFFIFFFIFFFNTIS
jgi:hypothetical protein